MLHPVIWFLVVVYIVFGICWYFFSYRPKTTGRNLDFSYISSLLRHYWKKPSVGRSKTTPGELPANAGVSQYPHDFIQPTKKGPGLVSSGEFTFSSEQALNRKPTLELKGNSLRPRLMNYDEPSIAQKDSKFYGPLGSDRHNSGLGSKSLDFGHQSSHQTGSAAFKPMESHQSGFQDSFNPFFHPVVGGPRFITSKNAPPLTAMRQNPFESNTGSLNRAPLLSNPNSQDHLPFARTSSVNYSRMDESHKQVPPTTRDYNGFNSHTNNVMQNEENMHTEAPKDSASKKALQSTTSAFKKHESPLKSEVESKFQSNSLIQKPTRKEEKDMKFQQKQSEANEKASKVIETYKADSIMDESEGMRNENYQTSRSRTARMKIYLSDQSDEDQEGSVGGKKNQRNVSLPAHQPSKKIKMSNEVSIPADSSEKKHARIHFNDEIEKDDELGDGPGEEETPKKQQKYRIGEYKGTYKKGHQFVSEDGKNFNRDTTKGSLQNGKSSKRFVNDTDLSRPMRVSNPSASQFESKSQAKATEETNRFEDNFKPSNPLLVKTDEQKDRQKTDMPQEKSSGFFSNASLSKSQDSSQKLSGLFGETPERKSTEAKTSEQNHPDSNPTAGENRTPNPLFGNGLSKTAASILNKSPQSTLLDDNKALAPVILSPNNAESQKERTATQQLQGKSSSLLNPFVPSSKATADAKKENGHSITPSGLFSNLGSLASSTSKSLLDNALSSNPTQSAIIDQTKEKPPSTPSLFGGIINTGGLLIREANSPSTQSKATLVGGSGLLSAASQTQSTGLFSNGPLGNKLEDKGLLLGPLLAASSAKEKPSLVFSGGLFNNDQKTSSSLLGGNLGSGGGSSLFSNLNSQQNGK